MYHDISLICIVVVFVVFVVAVVVDVDIRQSEIFNSETLYNISSHLL